jgi:hypothetical protein
VAQLSTLGGYRTMKHTTKVLMIVPPALFVVMIASANIMSSDSKLIFQIFATLWVISSLALFVRGILILKSDRRAGYICMALAFVYLLFLSLTIPAKT